MEGKQSLADSSVKTKANLNQKWMEEFSDGSSADENLDQILDGEENFAKLFCAALFFVSQ